MYSKFPFKKSICDTLVAPSLLLFSQRIWPAFEKRRSQGTDVAKTHNRFNTIWYSLGYMFFFCCHHTNGSSNLPMNGSCRYLFISIIPAAVGLFFANICSTFVSKSLHNEVKLLDSWHCLFAFVSV